RLVIEVLVALAEDHADQIRLRTLAVEVRTQLGPTQAAAQPQEQPGDGAVAVLVRAQAGEAPGLPVALLQVDVGQPGRLLDIQVDRAARQRFRSVGRRSVAFDDCRVAALVSHDQGVREGGAGRVGPVGDLEGSLDPEPAGNVDEDAIGPERPAQGQEDRKSTRLNSSHRTISYAVFCLKKKKKKKKKRDTS